MFWLWLACTQEPATKQAVGGEESAPVVQSKSLETADIKALKGEAIGLVKQFGGQLKPKLKGAMQSGGTVEAIKVCAESAPTIAQQVSTESGWTVKRVSLKARNATTATPDQWERETLAWFDAQQAAGVDPQTLVKAEIVEGTYRFMKAQPVEGLCLSCHGETLSPETEGALKEHYPNDVARGYELGQIRGAFSLSKVLD